MTSEASTPARCAIARTVVFSSPCSPNSTCAASRIRCAVAARRAARVFGSSIHQTVQALTLQALSESVSFAQQMMSQRTQRSEAAKHPEGCLMRVVTIEEHWTTPDIDRALRGQPSAVRDESLALNDVGDISARLFDLGESRIEAMDAAGIDVQILSLAPPGTHGLPAADAVALARAANDRASAAVDRYPTRLRALTTLPMSDPDAALAELERTAGAPGHVGIMSYGRSGDRPLDDPANDEVLAAAARLGRPIFIHPQMPPNAVRDASYRGF